MSSGSNARPKFPLRLDGLQTSPKTLVKPPGERVTAAVRTTTAPSATAPNHRPVLRPQQPVAQAAADKARLTPALGLGLDSTGVRQRMVLRLRQDGLRHEAVAQAMSQVHRHQFVDPALATQAYEDTSLPIGLGQTISKPSVVARMIELLMGGANASRTGTLGRTLEVGTGCGYQAAVLAQLSRQVISVERLKPLHDKAKVLLAPLRLTQIRLVYGDGMLGHPPNAPYDSIIAAAGGAAIPDAWLTQLAVGGRLVAPVHDEQGRRQVLVVVDRTDDGYVRSVHQAVHFVPLKSGLD